MDLSSVLTQYHLFCEPAFTNRHLKHAQVMALIDELPDTFRVHKAGTSVLGRELKLVEWGNGPVKVFLWSQMHGDEPTGTMAMFDLFNFLQCTEFKNITDVLKQSCTLHLLPMVNPDGAEVFTRRNSQLIDINRDFLKTNTAEGAVLKKLRNDIHPAFGFNLHDQTTLWSVKGSKLPATLSYLAPAPDESLSITPARKNAMLVIADMFEALNEYLPGQIGLFDGSYEPRAFGDNFQMSGTSTILIEAGGYKGDLEKQEIRKYFFMSMLSGLQSIATENFLRQSLENYHSIPSNDKALYHLIVHRLQINGLECSLSLNYEETLNPDGASLTQAWYIHDIGDLTGWNAYAVFDQGPYTTKGTISINKEASLDILQEGKLILSFKNGILVHSTTQLN